MRLRFMAVCTCVGVCQTKYMFKDMKNLLNTTSNYRNFIREKGGIVCDNLCIARTLLVI